MGQITGDIMNKTNILKIVLFVSGFLFLLAGCASLEKARTLHNQGKDSEALKMAASYLKDGDPAVRLEAVNLVGEIGGDEAGRLLMPVMDDEEAEVKNAAIRNIGKLKYVKAASKLVEMSIKTEGETFEEVATAIRTIGDPAIELLVKRYNSAVGASEKNAYKKAMFEVGPSVAAGIARSLKGKSFFENRANFDLLIEFKNPMVSEWLLDEIENEEVADLVVEALEKLGNNAILPVTNRLRAMVSREGFIETKERLIKALGNLKAKQAVTLLEQMAKDKNERVSNAAEFSLKKIRGF
jgi:HEAT repeat protein